MSLANQFLRQPGNHSFSTAVTAGWNRFIQRGDLCNSHVTYLTAEVWWRQRVTQTGSPTSDLTALRLHFTVHQQHPVNVVDRHETARHLPQRKSHISHTFQSVFFASNVSEARST